MTGVSWQIRKRWLLIVLVMAGQLAVLLPGSLWLAGWINQTAETIIEQRLSVAAKRHILQMADLVSDMGPLDLADGSDDRARLQQLIDRMGRPYGAAIVVLRDADSRVIAQPREMGIYSLNKTALATGEASQAGARAIAERDLAPLGLTLVALPHRGDISALMARFGSYVRWTIIALMIVIVVISTGLTALIVQRYENRLAGINTNLERLVDERSRELLKSRNAVIFGLAMLAESRDGETGLHLDRVRAYVRLLGNELIGRHAEVNEEFVSTIEETSALHDIGKVGVPDAVLLNPEQLTEDERQVMRKHPLIGFDTMMAVKRRWGDDQFLITACEICFAHHERWDGKGYPFGLSGDTIPLSARIVALADVYDALTTQRVYKDAVPHERAREYITRESGGHFDPAIVEAFLRCEDGFQAVLEDAGRT